MDNVQYTVRNMLQIKNISDVRKNLSNLVNQVARTKKPIVILRDSTPTAVLYPFTEHTAESYADNLLTISGSWFSTNDYKKIRKEVAQRLKKHNE